MRMNEVNKVRITIFKSRECLGVYIDVIIFYSDFCSEFSFRGVDYMIY